MKFLFHAGAVALAISSFCTAPAVADVVTSFTTAEGFADGEINGQTGNFSVPVIAQAGIVVQDAAGGGELSVPGSGFLRAIFEADQFNVSDFAAGDTITLTATGVTITRPAAAIPSGVFGLTSDNGPGSATNEVGLQLALDTDGNVLLDTQAFAVSGSAVDTGFDIGETFDIQTIITANGDGSFDAFSTIGTATLLTADNASLDDENFGVIFQSQGPIAEPTTIGGLSIAVDIAAIPEPGSLSLLGLIGIAAFTRRTRKR